MNNNENWPPTPSTYGDARAAADAVDRRFEAERQAEDVLPPQPKRIEIKEEDLPPERERVVITAEDLQPEQSSTSLVDSGTPIAENVWVDDVKPHVEGFNASLGDSTYIDESPTSKVETDEDTALAMAEAGTEKRSAASKNRGQLRFIRELELAAEDAARNPLLRRRRLEKLFSNDHRFDVPIGSELWNLKNSVNDSLDGPYRKEYRASLEKTRARLKEEARIADELADRQETWAKALHEHPPSEAYKQAHPNIKFGAHSLAYIEGWVAEDMKLIANLKQEAEEGLSPSDLVNARGGVIDWIDALEPYEAEEVLDKFDARLDALDTSGEATNADYEQLYKEVLKLYVRHLEADNEGRAQVLDDLRSGRASNPDYKPPEPVSTPAELDERTRALIDEEGREDRE